MNAYLYGFGPKQKRKWLMVDCGVSFAGDDLPGIDLVIPDVRFLEERRGDLVGIIITHAHEDHIGALIDLWPRLKAPVYATQFAADLLDIRRMQEQGAPKIPIHGRRSGHAPAARSVRRGVHRGRPFDPQIDRARHPDAGRHRAPHRRLEDRSRAGRQLDHRREAPRRDRRGGRARSRVQFHQRHPWRRRVPARRTSPRRSSISWRPRRAGSP